MLLALEALDTESPHPGFKRGRLHLEQLGRPPFAPDAPIGHVQYLDDVVFFKVREGLGLGLES